MALFFFLFLVFLIVGACCWFQGVWSNAVNAVNVVVAGLIATNYYEPICSLIEDFGMASWTYVLDIFVFWLLFAIVYGVLRLIGDGLSRTKLEFSFPVDMAARSILAIVTAWLFVCLTAFSLQFAPIGADHFPSETSASFLLVSPEKQWNGFAWICSAGSLARGPFDDSRIHPEDKAANAQVFNSREFPARHYHRRKNLETNEGLRAPR